MPVFYQYFQGVQRNLILVCYGQCCWQVRDDGQFRPLVNSQPYLGKTRQTEKLAEYKVEMICYRGIYNKGIFWPSKSWFQ